MITNRQKNFITYFLSKSLFLGIGFSLIFEISGNDTWLCFILGSLLGLIFCYLIKKILDYKKNKDLTTILDEMPILGKFLRLLLIIFSIIIINEILFIIQIFAKSFFLINSNTFLVILPIIILSVYVAFHGYKLLSYVSECLFPIAFFFTIIGFIALFSKVDLTNLKPFLSQTNLNLIKGTLYYFSISSIPTLLLLDLNFENNDISKNYIFVSIILTLLSIFIIGVLGQFLISIYRFPEYMLLKDIVLFNFIEKVENIISISWIIDNFILLCLATCFLKRMLPKKYNNYTFLSIICSIFLIVCLIFGDSYIKDLYIYLYLPHLLFIIGIPFITILFIHCIKNKKRV